MLNTLCSLLSLMLQSLETTPLKCTEINTLQFFSGKLSFQKQKDGYKRYLQMEDVYFNYRHTAMLTGVINLLSEHFWLSVF